MVGPTNATVEPSRSWNRQQLVSALGGRYHTALIAALLLIGVVVRYRPAVGLLVGLAIAVPLERRWRRHPFSPLRPGLGADVLHFLFSNTLKTAAIIAAAGLSWLCLHHLALHPVGAALAAMPGWARTVVTFAAFNVTYYWEHRLAHSWGFLWRFHSVHHSSERLDWLAAARLHPLEGFIGGFVLTAPLILAGFSVFQLGIAGVIFAVNDILIHANVSWRLRRVSRWIPTPEYHHWHHSNELESRNKNFGWPVLDRLFGTFYLPSDRRPSVYGIDHPTPTGYFGQLADPLRPDWPQMRQHHPADG